MKKLFKNIVIKMLSLRVKSLIKKSDARVYGITGSVGKTTLKEVLSQILSNKYQVLSSEGGFNTRIGILLSILGEKESGFSSFKKWLGIIWRSYTKKYKIPERIVLEYGVDKKGDMNKLIKIITPNVAILTRIAPVHMAEGQFSSLEEIAQEKAKLLKTAQTVLVNEDCEYSRKINHEMGRILFSGKTAREEENGFSFEYKDEKYSVPSFGAFQYSSFLPAVIIGVREGIRPSVIRHTLGQFIPPTGRGRILEGINRSIIWDSSYNSSPLATEKMLETLSRIPAKRKIAFLGNMNELGEKTSHFHEELGRKAVLHADLIFFMGLNHEDFRRGIAGKKPFKVFRNISEASEELKKTLREGDLILVKGSQNKVRLERVIKEILRYKNDSKKLCRQGKEWAEI